MKALILAGGQGTRLRPVTYEIPKPLVPVKKKPILSHLVDLFARNGIDEVGILAARSHEADFALWQKHWGDVPSLKKISIFYEESPRGTFGGVPALADWFGADDFIMSNGDELKDFDLQALMKFHRAHKPVGTIALVEVLNPQEYGVPIMDGPNIREFLEKPANPPSNCVSSGLYMLNPAVFKYADPAKEFSMIEKDIFPQLAADGKLMGCVMENARWYDCGTMERWEKAIKEW